MLCRLQGFEETRKGVYYEYDSESIPLGEGAMGRVYKGFRVTQDSSERVPVAIKVIYDNIPEKVIQRARREASVRIDSPYLLRMYGFIEMPYSIIYNGQNINRNRYYVVMELLDGVTLYDLVNGHIADKNGNVIPAIKSLYDKYISDRYSAIKDIFIQVLRGVIALHSAKFIHRDIDPTNIMVTSDGHVKLIDFGICKPIDSLGTVDQNLTSTGVFMGKVNYAAPELVIGDVTHQGPTTDIYALGILLFQLCTGHLPFKGEDNDILFAHMRKQIPLREIENRSLKNIIAKATEKSQKDRYSKAELMLEDIEKKDSINPMVWIVLSIVAISVVGIFYFANDKKDFDDDSAIEQTESSHSFVSIQKRLWSEDLSIVRTAFAELRNLAEEKQDANAMFEYGLTYSVGNSFFDIPTQRQEKLNILPNIDIANKWLLRSYNIDKQSYRAAYWRLNNLVVKKQLDDSVVSIDEISMWLKIFDKITKDKNDEVAKRYKIAVNAMRDQITGWIK